MSNPKTVRVKKTDKINQRKLSHVARRYNIPPISVREIQLGYPEDIPALAANMLIKDGLVQPVKTELRTNQERVDSLTAKEKTKPVEPVEKPEEPETDLTMTDDEPVVSGDDDDSFSFDGDDNDTTADPEDEGEEV